MLFHIDFGHNRTSRPNLLYDCHYRREPGKSVSRSGTNDRVMLYVDYDDECDFCRANQLPGSVHCKQRERIYKRTSVVKAHSMKETMGESSIVDIQASNQSVDSQPIR